MTDTAHTPGPWTVDQNIQAALKAARGEKS